MGSRHCSASHLTLWSTLAAVERTGHRFITKLAHFFPLRCCLLHSTGLRSVAFSLALATLSVTFTFLFAAGTAVAAHAIVEVGDTLLLVLGLHIGRRVLVATVAGVLLVVVDGVAGHASRVVVLVQREVLVVVKGGRLLGMRLVALRTIAGHLLVHRVGWCLMAALKASQFGLGEGRMVETCWLPGLRLVALGTADAQGTVQVICRRDVAGVAEFSRSHTQHAMQFWPFNFW